MKTVVVMVGIALLFLAMACSTPSVEPGSTPSVFVGLGYCLAKENEEIAPSLRQEIHELDEQIIDAIQKDKLDEFLGYFATGLPNEQKNRQQIIDNFPALAGAVKEKEFEEYQDYHCTCSGGGSTPCTVLPKTDYDFLISIERTGNEMFMSLLETQELQRLLLSITYVKQHENWKVYQVYIGSFKIAEKNAVQWHEEALVYYNQGYLVPAMLRMQMSSVCLNPAPFLKYQKEGEIIELIEKAQAELKDEYSLPIHLSDIEGDPVIYYIKPKFVQQEIIPDICYVTSIKLEDINSLKEEANLMSPIVQHMFPGIDEGTTHILFTAFSEPPTDPNKKYAAYSTAVEVD